MRVTQSLFATQSWVIIAPLCSLLRVGTQGWLQDLVTHALATGEHGYLLTPLSRPPSPQRLPSSLYWGQRRSSTLLRSRNG